MAGLGFLLALVAGMQGSGAVGLTPVIFIFPDLLDSHHGGADGVASRLSAVTKLAPAKIVGMTMGAWFPLLWVCPIIWLA